MSNAVEYYSGPERNFFRFSDATVRPQDDRAGPPEPAAVNARSANAVVVRRGLRLRLLEHRRLTSPRLPPARSIPASITVR